jgi:hypothetical protein
VRLKKASEENDLTEASNKGVRSRQKRTQQRFVEGAFGLNSRRPRGGQDTSKQTGSEIWESSTCDSRESTLNLLPAEGAKAFKADQAKARQ